VISLQIEKLSPNCNIIFGLQNHFQELDVFDYDLYYSFYLNHEVSFNRVSFIERHILRYLGIRTYETSIRSRAYPNPNPKDIPSTT
jgi:hypothetical protein